jgi:L-asparaginase II
MNDAKNSCNLPTLVEVTRGAIVESRHCGAIVAVKPNGEIAAQLGDVNLITSTRSTIKPIQAIPFITSGAADRFNITERELALVCASHGGESFHTETVAKMLARIGLEESDLRCGAHLPYNEDAARALQMAGKTFTQLHNNCSGKHTGMLATCVHRGWSIADYTAQNHPLQQEIISIFRRLGELPEDLPIAIDGCSAPTFGVSLESLARAFAKLASFTSSNSRNPEIGSGSRFQDIAFDSDIAQAGRRIVKAMMAFPEMVGGTGRLDTALMQTARGTLICKVGAEASYVIGVLPCEKFPQGLGVALKIQDGAPRALATVVIETLAQLGVLDDAQQTPLANLHKPVVNSHRGLHVGDINPIFNLPISDSKLS